MNIPRFCLLSVTSRVTPKCPVDLLPPNLLTVHNIAALRLSFSAVFRNMHSLYLGCEVNHGYTRLVMEILTPLICAGCTLRPLHELFTCSTSSPEGLLPPPRVLSNPGKHLQWQMFLHPLSFKACSTKVWLTCPEVVTAA